MLSQMMKLKIPKIIKNIIKYIVHRIIKKDVYEFSFWRSRFEMDNGVFDNSHYSRLLLCMAGEKDDLFIEDKIVGDFGCGPRGSLVWAKKAKLRIGIDVLADQYADEFSENILSHGMIYVKSTEKIIPIPSNFFDIIFTLNAIDHVESFPIMCAEIIRILKPGGLFIGSFNLEERATSAEPQQLNEVLIKKYLLDFLDVQSYRVTIPGSNDDIYSPFFNNTLEYETGQQGILWVRGSIK